MAANNPERPSNEALEKGHASDKAHELKGTESIPVGERPDYKLVAENALIRAELEAADAGKKLTEDAKKGISSDAKLEAARWHSERKALEGYVPPGSRIFTCNEDMPFHEFVVRPIVGEALGTSILHDGRGIFPGLDNTIIHKGEHLVVLPGGKNILALSIPKDLKSEHALDENSKIITVFEGTRSDQNLERAIAQNKGFEIKNGVVRFMNKRTELKTTLGSMFPQEALSVNGTIVLRGPDGQYHFPRGNVLSPKRVLVFNGTKIDTNVDPEELAKIKSSLEKGSKDVAGNS